MGFTVWQFSCSLEKGYFIKTNETVEGTDNHHHLVYVGK